MIRTDIDHIFSDQINLVSMTGLFDHTILRALRLSYHLRWRQEIVYTRWAIQVFLVKYRTQEDDINDWFLFSWDEVKCTWCKVLRYVWISYESFCAHRQDSWWNLGKSQPIRLYCRISHSETSHLWRSYVSNWQRFDVSFAGTPPTLLRLSETGKMMCICLLKNPLHYIIGILLTTTQDYWGNDNVIIFLSRIDGTETNWNFCSRILKRFDSGRTSFWCFAKFYRRSEVTRSKVVHVSRLSINMKQDSWTHVDYDVMI